MRLETLILINTCFTAILPIYGAFRLFHTSYSTHWREILFKFGCLRDGIHLLYLAGIGIPNIPMPSLVLSGCKIKYLLFDLCTLIIFLGWFLSRLATLDPQRLIFEVEYFLWLHQSIVIVA